MTARGCLLAGLSLACGAAGAGGWQADLGARDSQWREWRAGGVPLLEERGPLVLAGLAATGQMGGLNLTLRAEGAGGRRDYAGHTSLGVPLRTDVDVREGSIALDIGWPLGNAWQLRGVLQPTGLSRRLNGTSQAAGYTERWRWVLSALGLQWQQPFAAGELALHAQAAVLFDAQVRLTLPGSDASTLRPRHGRGWQGGGAWRTAWSDDGRWILTLQRDRLRFDASDAVPLTRGGVLRGGLLQPRTQTDAWSARVGFERRWD